MACSVLRHRGCCNVRSMAKRKASNMSMRKKPAALETPSGRPASLGPLEFDDPTTRPLKVYAFDPSRGRLLGNQMSMAVRFQRLEKGPVVVERYARNAIAIVDYDASNDCYYVPVDLDDRQVLIRGGIDPDESDPRFHQQMVYAIVTDTIQHFEAALGRTIHWRRDTREIDEVDEETVRENIWTLNIYPHAMVGANAFYCPRAHGILFGYFRADENDMEGSLPGQIVYTCLSHDIIVHETTHAIIDGIRGHFTEPTNPDVLAFHEAFADLAALFRHFSHEEVLLDTIRRTDGMLFRADVSGDVEQQGREPVTTAEQRDVNPLISLALQFGSATGRGRALRSAIGSKPNRKDIRTILEPHQRGAILVAAVFDAYFSIYLRRTKELLQFYRSIGGSILARHLAEAASSTARTFFNMCVRSLDYCPPVDITFGDFLRAIITADIETHPTDELGVRDTLMNSFRIRGIVPGTHSFSEAAVAWPQAKGLPPITNLEFGDISGLTAEQQDRIGDALRAYFNDSENARAAGFDPDYKVRIRSFHPVVRTCENGTIRTELVVEAIQTRRALLDPKEPALGTFKVRGGATLIIGKPTLPEIRAGMAQAKSSGEAYTAIGKIRYVIGKRMHGLAGSERELRQRLFYERSGLVEGDEASRSQIDFALEHGG
jgi:hypothetical protein